MRGHKYVRQSNRHGIRRKRSVPDVCDGKCGTVADNDAAIGGDGSEGGKITRMSKHVSRGPGVHVPITTSSVVVRHMSGMQPGEEHRIPGNNGDAAGKP